MAISRASEEECPWGILADALCEQPDVDTVVLFVVSDTNDQLVPFHVSGKYGWNLKDLAITMGERMSGWVAAVRQPMLNADAALDLFDVAGHSLRSAAAIPVAGPRGARAVVTLYSTHTDVFLPVHTRLVEEASAVVAYRETTTRARAEILDHRPITTAAQSRLRVVPSNSSSKADDTHRPPLRRSSGAS
jgi:hypothetical protein